MQSHFIKMELNIHGYHVIKEMDLYSASMKSYQYQSLDISENI